MKKLIVLSLLSLFLVAAIIPVNAIAQEPQKTEQTEKKDDCCKDKKCKKECKKEGKKECKKGDKKESCKENKECEKKSDNK